MTQEANEIGMMTQEELSALQTWLADAIGRQIVVRSAQRLSGGAVRENFAADVLDGEASMRVVVRKDGKLAFLRSHSSEHEFALIGAARAAGVAVPDPVAFCHDPAVLGRPFGVYAFVPGIAFGPRLVKGMLPNGLEGEKLLEQLGRQIARVHRIAPSEPSLGFLGPEPQHPALEEISQLRLDLDVMRISRPALEWGLRWAELHAPKARKVCLTHRDFRTGNYMVDASGVTALLDWEFAGWGDPLADLGWFCAECWRFARPDLEAGGIGPRNALYKGYAEESGVHPDDDAVRYWEIVAHLRWAVIALAQGLRHASGQEPSLPLALTGRIASQLELAVLRATAPIRWTTDAS